MEKAKLEKNYLKSQKKKKAGESMMGWVRMMGVVWRRGGVRMWVGLGCGWSWYEWWGYDGGGINVWVGLG